MSTIERIRQITPRDLALLGLQDIAYVKPVHVRGIESYAIHAADGSEMAVVPSRELADATILENNLAPVSVH